MSVPSRITSRPVATIMSFAVDLDRKACRQTCEVQHIRSLRTLLPEPEPPRLRLQRPPQKTLGGRHLLPQPPSHDDGACRGTNRAMPDSAPLLLPGTGRGTARRRRGVEGPHNLGGMRIGPSTSLRLVPLPVPGRNQDHCARLRIKAVRSMVHTISPRWLSIRCSKVTIPASGRDLESFSEITSVSALSVSPMKTGLGIRTLS